MKKIKYRYVGGGEFLPGIPARDLTADETKDLDVEALEALEASGLYELVETHMKSGPTENASTKRQDKDSGGNN